MHVTDSKVPSKTHASKVDDERAEVGTANGDADSAGAAVAVPQVARVAVDVTAESPSRAAPLAERKQPALTAAAAAALQAQYARPSRYTSNIFVDCDEQWSVQKTIRELLRGSSSSITLSSSPFAERVPRAPSTSRTGSEAAFAKRRLSLVAPSSSSVGARAAVATVATAPSALVRSGVQGSAGNTVLPPLPRKRA